MTVTCCKSIGQDDYGHQFQCQKPIGHQGKHVSQEILVNMGNAEPVAPLHTEAQLRVARALFHERSPLASWDDAPEWRRERYLASARVAIDAMRGTE
jgi:hypothetical protein